MNIDNPFFYLPSSQLFPFTTVSTKINVSNDLVTAVFEAKKLADSGSYLDSLSLYNELINKFPDLPFLYACRSILKTKMEEEEGAFYDYQVAKRLDFNYHIFLEWLSNSGAMLESSELEEFLSNEQDEEQYYINRATLYVQHFEYDKAVSDFSKAYMIGNNAVVLISRGAVSLRMLRYDEALADFNAAISRDDKLIQGYLQRAKLFSAIHEFELADNDFNKAISLNDQDASAYEERAQFYESVAHWELAIADYSKVISINPDDFYVYVLRADLYQKIGDLESALADYNRAIVLNPYYSDLYQYRGDIRKSLGDSIGAEEDYLKFVELEDE